MKSLKIKGPQIKILVYKRPVMAEDDPYYWLHLTDWNIETIPGSDTYPLTREQYILAGTLEDSWELLYVEKELLHRPLNIDLVALEAPALVMVAKAIDRRVDLTVSLNFVYNLDKAKKLVFFDVKAIEIKETEMDIPCLPWH